MTIAADLPQVEKHTRLSILPPGVGETFSPSLNCEKEGQSPSVQEGGGSQGAHGSRIQEPRCQLVSLLLCELLSGSVKFMFLFTRTQSLQQLISM